MAATSERQAWSGYKKILCPVDFSETSRAAFDRAAELARLTGASLTLVHVYHLPPMIPDGVVMPNLLQELADDARKAIGQLEREARERGITTVAAVVREGVPWDSIVTLARDEGHDLIVIGTHGRSGLKHVLLGSVAERVVRHASCPVLVERAHAHG